MSIRRYGRRYWAVWDGEVLVAVTVYKKGAQEILRRLNREEQHELEMEAMGP